MLGRQELKDCDTANVLQGVARRICCKRTVFFLSMHVAYSFPPSLSLLSLTEQVEAALKDVSPAGSRPELACYGIGALLGRRAEQYQLAWFLNLAERLRTAATPTLFDPVLNASERVALAQLGCRVPRENNGCRHVAGSEVPLLVYMPHGGLRMYDNLLSVSAAAGVASRLCIVGNDLQGYVDAMREDELATCAPALTALAAALQCADPPPPFSAIPGAFNDTIVQWLDCGQLPDFVCRPVDGAGDAAGHDFSIVERDLPALPPAAAAAADVAAAASEAKAS
jgi:hypothetical protein